MSYKQALQENNIDLQSLLEAVNELPDQVSLPTLSNPASPAEILSGYEAINDAGEVVTGTALATATTATAAQILSGKTAYNSAGELLTGTMAKGLTALSGTLSWKGTDYTFDSIGGDLTYTNTWTLPQSPKAIIISGSIAYGGLAPANSINSMGLIYQDGGRFSISGKTLTHVYKTALDLSTTTQSLKYYLVY